MTEYMPNGKPKQYEGLAWHGGEIHYTAENIHYVGIAFQNEHDAKLAQEAIEAIRGNTDEAFTITPTTRDVHDVMDALHAIGNPYRRISHRYMWLQDQCRAICNNNVDRISKIFDERH